jgi:protein gp37
MAARLQAMEHPLYSEVTRKSGGRPVWTGKLHFSEAAIELPLNWKKPRKIFVNSMSDLFQDGVASEFIARIWQIMEAADWHVYQVLTKRPDNMLKIASELRLPVLRNVWLGTSVESHEYAERIEILRKVPACVRFISFEPLLASVGEVNLESIDWAIVGGESGPRARPMQIAWVDEIKRQCRKSGTAFFFKQWGGTNKKASGRVFRGRTWDEYPKIATARPEELATP